MEIIFVVQLLQPEVEEGGQKTGPHVEKIQTVKTVGHHKKVASQRIRMRVSL